MKILVIGKGGREHAIAWKFAQSPKVSKVFMAPGNDGCKDIAELVNISDVDIDGLTKFAIDNKIDLTFVGPESSLELGIADRFINEGLKIFGPTHAATQIESSKTYCKDVMEKYNIPTAGYKAVSTLSEAKDYIDSTNTFPIVLKVDGLAAGKGVMIPTNKEECNKYLSMIFTEEKFGKQEQVVIEEFLVGEEFSQLCFVHGNTLIPMQVAQDHKRALDGDLGENTGGMGAYTPVNHLPKSAINEGIQISQKMADALVSEGRPFTGVMYTGLINTKDGAKVIEFNARFGDPETEVLLPAMKTDIVDVIDSVLNNTKIDIEWSDEVFIGVVLASKGYPESYKKGLPLNTQNLSSDDLTFSMGVLQKDGQMLNNGGRVLFAVGHDKDFSKAKNSAYGIINKIKDENYVFRTDIGHQWGGK